jgi:3-oxoacyl-[acyl-carrier protein] reductase
MFKDKVVIITGAAGGIGRALAAALARTGARLVLTDIRRGPLEKLKESLAPAGAEILAVEHDVTLPESWENLLGLVLRTFGRIDVLINNAGVLQPGAAWEVSREKVEWQVRVNLLGTIFGCQAALRVMIGQKSGKIVNFASLGGIVPMPGETVYSATKFGVRGYSLSLAGELQGTPVSVSAVCPDSVDTPQNAYELLHDETFMAFIDPPLRPEKVARRILKAAGGRNPEVLVPAGMGVFSRTAMAWPQAFFLLLPLLRKIGLRHIARRRQVRGAGGEVWGLGNGLGR